MQQALRQLSEIDLFQKFIVKFLDPGGMSPSLLSSPSLRFGSTDGSITAIKRQIRNMNYNLRALCGYVRSGLQLGNPSPFLPLAINKRFNHKPVLFGDECDPLDQFLRQA